MMKKLIILLCLIVLTGCGQKKKETPIDAIDDAKETLVVSKVRNILSDAEHYYIYNLLDSDGELPGEVVFSCVKKSCTGSNNEKFNIQYNVTSGKIKVTEEGDASITEKIIVDGYACMTENKIIKCEKK